MCDLFLYSQKHQEISVLGWGEWVESKQWLEMGYGLSKAHWDIHYTFRVLLTEVEHAFTTSFRGKYFDLTLYFDLTKQREQVSVE